MSFDFKNLMRTQCEEVKLRDGFWLNMYEQYSTHTINFMFDMFEKFLSFDNFGRVINGQRFVLHNTDENAGQILKPVDATDVYHSEWMRANIIKLN